MPVRIIKHVGGGNLRDEVSADGWGIEESESWFKLIEVTIFKL